MPSIKATPWGSGSTLLGVVGPWYRGGRCSFTTCRNAGITIHQVRCGVAGYLEAAITTDKTTGGLDI